MKTSIRPMPLLDCITLCHQLSTYYHYIDYNADIAIPKLVSYFYRLYSKPKVWIDFRQE